MTGHIFIISGPSGVGKGTLITRLLNERTDYIIPSSYTTREPRINEGTKKIYHFVSKSEFMLSVKEGRILEYETVHGNLYGTDRESIDSAIVDNKIIITEIEPKGARTFKELFPESTTIFIRPEDINDLINRIKKDFKRLNIADSEIKTRLLTAQEEMTFEKEADYTIVNKDNQIDQAYQELKKIIDQEIRLV